jgi:cysteine synthase A
MDISQASGNTPLLHLRRISRIMGCHIHVKLEAANTGGSAAVRIAGHYVENAVESGRLQKGGCIVEACLPNMAIALAQACVQTDVRLMVVMPEDVNPQILPLLHTMGAEIMLTDASQGFAGALRKAEEMNKDIWTSCRLNITSDPAGPDAYRRLLGPEILRDCRSQGFEPDAFIAGIGTGATMMGAGTYLKEQSGTCLVAVEPAESAVLTGGAPGKHGIDGIGLGIVPELFDPGAVDEIQQVATADAIKSARRLLNVEAVCCGTSTGACLHAALQLSFRDGYRGKHIVIMGYDTGERYSHRALFGQPSKDILLNALSAGKTGKPVS